MRFQIRKADENDVPHILAMIREFAEFEQLFDFCEVTEERLRVALFGKESVAEAIIAIENEIPTAYAIFYPNFLTFRGQCGFFLEDIYLKPKIRGKGLGEKMLQHIAKLGKSRGFERIDFQVLDGNKSAVNFYIRLGAVIDETTSHFKFTDQAFQKLAS